MHNVKKVTVALFIATMVYLASLAVIYAGNGESKRWYCLSRIHVCQIKDPTFPPENQSEYLVFNESYPQITDLVNGLNDVYVEDWNKAEAIHNQTYGKKTEPHYFRLNGTSVYSEYFYWQPNGTYWYITDEFVSCGYYGEPKTVQVAGGVTLAVLWAVTAVMWIRKRVNHVETSTLG